MLPIPMHLHLHKDGLIFLRDFFAAALTLGFLVLVYSGAFAVPFGWLLERAERPVLHPIRLCIVQRNDNRRLEVSTFSKFS